MLANIEKITDRTERFRAVAEYFSQLAAGAGVRVIPYAESGPVRFPRLPEQMQEAVLYHFERYVAVAEEVVRAGESLAHDNYFLWRMFHKLGVHPVSDMMARIQPGEIIEIYNADYVQIFRNLAFFSICSYTLDDLLCRPFWELFRRDGAVTEALVEVGKGIFSKTISTTHEWSLGTHVVDEIDSPARYHSVVEMRIASPLFDTAGRVVASVNTLRVISCQRTSAD